MNGRQIRALNRVREILDSDPAFTPQQKSNFIYQFARESFRHTDHNPTLLEEVNKYLRDYPPLPPVKI